MMNRRTFLCGLTLGALSTPIVGEAQLPPKVRLIGALDAADSQGWAGFRQGLRDLGWNDERHVAIAYRSSRKFAQGFNAWLFSTILMSGPPRSAASVSGSRPRELGCPSYHSP